MNYSLSLAEKLTLTSLKFYKVKIFCQKREVSSSFIGQKDTELSEYGREQCRLVGQRIASTETVSHIISSDLIRTVKVSNISRSESNH